MPWVDTTQQSLQDRGRRFNLPRVGATQQSRRVNQPTLLKALQQILASCQHLLALDGLLVLTARPYRHRDHLVDLPGQLTQVAEATGLLLYERNAALLVGLREDRLVPAPPSSS